MEVHHHPQLDHQPKPWKEYLLEGLMIFVAVTMGFFAESLREHITDRGKEKQYMQAMIGDLQKDTTEIKAEIIYADGVMSGLDSLFTVLHSKELTAAVQVSLYRLNTKYCRLIGLEFSDAASIQLKNTGGMRLIQNQQVTDGITHYWKASQRLKDHADYFNLKINVLGEEGYKIFDWSYVKNFTHRIADSTGTLRMQIAPGARLLISNKQQLTQYANRVIVLVNSLQGWYLPELKKQETLETGLIHLIKNHYDLD